ncbi:hypothetical protein CAEBREN_29223 [Caenorhabditis brenneri]|uniref:glucuronosyltransferase n=1 Tax=Caenorhabditis brenneri TaxID=135651 RepID=G0NA32_CAEBE|nr:hypothetical protein CAEBREN_29223 [Caenorhabditis brenneri]
MSSLFSSHCRNVMSKARLIEELKNENFDLAITEPFDTCAYALFEAISIRAHVAVYSCSRLDHVSEIIGQPVPLSYVPGMQSSFGEKMNIWERFMNYFQFKGSSYIFQTIGDKGYEAAKEFYPNIRSWREVVPEASFIFTNSIPYLDFPSPTFDKMIPIGGFTVKTDKKYLVLEKKWSKILNQRRTNVLISFGTNARSVEMPEEYKKSLLEVFKSMPNTTFIWKYENPEDPFIKDIENVYLSSWFPQNELLADPRLTVFITHGGLASVMELATMGKPAVMIPLAADQTRNAEMLKRHGGAAVLTKFDLANPNLVKDTIENVLTDPRQKHGNHKTDNSKSFSYKKNAERLAEILNNQPTKPLETLVKYVEFAARFGKLPLMDNYGRHQSFIEYYFVDLISISLVLASVFLYLFFKIVILIVLNKLDNYLGMKTVVLFTILLLFTLESSSFKILIYTNLFGHSHVKALGIVADTLTDAGHNVTVLMPIIERRFINETCLNSTKNVIFIEQDDYSKRLIEKWSNRSSVWTSGGITPFNKATVISNLFGAHCKNVMSQTELIKEMKKENFDLAITEPFDTCAYAFFEAISIRAHVAVYSCSRLDHVSEIIGQPVPPSYVPGMYSPYGEKMNIWERLENYFVFKARSYMFQAIGDRNYEEARKFYPNIRPWREVLPEASFIFTNSIQFLDFPSPTFDKIIPIGGYTVKTEKKFLNLEEKWSGILDERKTNVLISFGTNAKSDEMPEKYKKSLLKVFKSMPNTTFIWKYENPEDPLIKGIENVHLSSWLPQNELLADHRLTAFITHGGLASVLELAMMGKPAITIPVAADQTRNGEMLKRHGGSILLSKFDLANAEVVKGAIEKVMNDKRYKKNAERLAEILRNQPTKPLEKLVKHLEFAARIFKFAIRSEKPNDKND